MCFACAEYLFAHEDASGEDTKPRIGAHSGVQMSHQPKQEWSEVSDLGGKKKAIFLPLTPDAE